MTNVALGIGLIIGVTLLLLNVREIVYLYRQLRKVESSGPPSWLTRVLLRSTATTAAISAIFLALLVVRIVFGPQNWTAIVSTLAILWLLLIPVLRGAEIRRHEPL